MSGPILLILRLALALALYAFVAWAFYTLWSDLRRQSRIVTAPQAPPVILSYTIDGQSQALRFTKPEISIGRDPTSDIYLESKTISAQHARLGFHHGQWWIEDLHSTNGTYLNQEPVYEPVVLTDGDELRCGQVILRVTLNQQEYNKVSL